jgi:hypothetical protein
MLGHPSVLSYLQPLPRKCAYLIGREALTLYVALVLQNYSLTINASILFHILNEHELLAAWYYKLLRVCS